jgi:diguanylate cyclase (GGDEF)-like protein/PAS domain S-box-containing protein
MTHRAESCAREETAAASEPATGHAGLPRDPTLEYKAILANASIGIAFTRDRKFFLCNPKFAEMFGWKAEELIGQPGMAVYPSRESYEALGAIAVPILSAGRQLDVEWEVRRKDGSTFLCRMIAKAIDPERPRQGTVWIVEDITERKRTDEALQRLLQEQELILDNATVGIVFSRDRIIQRVNRCLEEMTGRSAAELVGQSSEVLFAERADWERATRLAYESTPPGGIHETEWRFRRKDGSTFLCRTRGRRIDRGEAEQQWIWSMEDVSAERDAEERLRRALAGEELIVENAQVGILFIRDHLIQRANRRAAEMFGYPAGELAGMPEEALYARAERSRAEAEAIYANTPPGGTCTAELELRRGAGSTFVGRAVGRRVDAGEEAQQWIWIVEDVTAERERREHLERMVAERTQELVSANRRLQAEIHDRRQAEERAQHLADHDPLTGLPNRRLLEDRLAQAIARGDRTRKPTAVLFVDLDRFKEINDTLGHATGDTVLREVAGRVVRQLRVGDTVCRLGGDEFVVVLPEISRASDAAGVAQKILETVAQPCEIEDRELRVSASIGISVFPDDGADAETLIRNADAAMYHAKETGRGGYQFFTEQMNVAAARRVAIERELRRALQESELRLHLQPIVDAAGGATVAFEALLRWQHPARGLLGPQEFLQVAEDTGLTPRIGEWVLREACRWIASVGPERARALSVNLSARQFADPRLAERVAAVLRESGVRPALLVLEVSEATAMQHTDHAEATLAKLKELGVSLALDHFGSAYSNAARLRHFSLDSVKLDRSLVAEIGTGKRAEPIVAAMVALGRALGLRVVAVGVETEAQREFLRSCGCDGLQGFLLGRPREPQAVTGAVGTPDAAPC